MVFIFLLTFDGIECRKRKIKHPSPRRGVEAPEEKTVRITGRVRSIQLELQHDTLAQGLRDGHAGRWGHPDGMSGGDTTGPGGPERYRGEGATWRRMRAAERLVSDATMRRAPRPPPGETGESLLKRTEDAGSAEEANATKKTVRGVGDRGGDRRSPSAPADVRLRGGPGGTDRVRPDGQVAALPAPSPL